MGPEDMGFVIHLWSKEDVEANIGDKTEQDNDFEVYLDFDDAKIKMSCQTEVITKGAGLRGGAIWTLMPKIQGDRK